MPDAGKYSLGALAQANGIIVNNAHRALDDAKLHSPCIENYLNSRSICRSMS